MHIVVVTGFYYPYIVPPAGCAKHYLVELAKVNEVEVICPPSNIHYTKPIIKEGIKVSYINSLPNKFLSFIMTNQEEHRYKWATKQMFNLYRGLRFFKSKFTKEPYETSLVKPYVDRLNKIHTENPIDILISVSFKFYTHAASLKFKKMHPEVKWITYTTDPLAYNEVNTIEKRKLQFAIEIEQEVYSTCDHCITTEEMSQNIINDYHISPEKVLQLPFLLLDKPLRVDNLENNRPLVVYAGYLYNEIRNPKTMLEVFKRVKGADLQLNVAGDRFIRKMLSKETTSNIHIDGIVSRDKYLELLGRANFLINMCNAVKLQAPSKLTELVSTGKPIINFYYNEDSGYRMIERYPLGLNISNNMNYDDAAKKVSSFILENLHKSITYEAVLSLFPEHSLDAQMSKVCDLLSKL